MTALVLLTAPDCHLCGHGRAVLDALGTDWRERLRKQLDGAALSRDA